MLATQTALIASLLLTGASADGKQPLEKSKLVGHWRSVTLEGKDIGSAIIEMEAKFDNDGRVSMVAKVKQADGQIKEIKKEGKYKVTMKELEMTVDNETRRSKSWFQNDLLVIQDPELDSRVHFDRVKPK